MRVILFDEEMVAVQALTTGLARHGIVSDVGEGDVESLCDSLDSGYEAFVITLPHSRIDVPNFVTKLRHRRIGTPVIVLQSFRNSAQAVELINSGVDDVLAKPANIAELAARIRSVARRINGHIDIALTVGRFSFFFDGRMPIINGKVVKFSRRERELLECLVMRHGRIVNRQFIYNYIYGYSSCAADEKTVDVIMCKVRKKLRAYSGGEDYIQTFPGQGYRFADPEGVRQDGQIVKVAFEADAPDLADVIQSAA